ncbi:MAG: hypothetical protein RL291_769 [Pseudomonadota bacterium]
MDRADVAIIGAGIMGSATAYALMTKLGPSAKVVLIEADTSYQRCATARSAGGIRHQFSTPENIALSQATHGALLEIRELLGPDGDVPFRAHGYLIMASEAGLPVLEANAATQRAAGAETLVLGPAALSERFPWLATDGVAAGSFGPRGEGWIDPVLWMSALRKAAQIKGARLINDRVVGIATVGERVEALSLASGAKIAVGHVVNAAGPWAGAVARLTGLDLPVEPRKRYVYVVDCRNAPESLHKAPLTVDPSGVWFRPEGHMFICGVSPEEADEPKDGDLDYIDDQPFEEIVWPTLAARVPAFEALKRVSAWAGFYDYNTLDQNGIIGPHPELTNFLFCNGFSGHGLQQGYAAGRAVAELIVDGRFTTIDLQRFGYGRIRANRPLLELNVS